MQAARHSASTGSCRRAVVRLHGVSLRPHNICVYSEFLHGAARVGAGHLDSERPLRGIF